MSKKFFTLTSLAVATLVAAGCGGGGGSSGQLGVVTTLAPTNGTTTPTTPATTASTDTTLTGSVVKGPVGNATVTVKKPDGTACGTTTTNAAGLYSFTTACTGDVVVEVTGGTYTDEATNTTKTLDTPLKAVLTASGGTVNGVVTPLTTMAFSYAFASNSAATRAAFDAQAAKVATQFGLTGVNLATTLPVVSGTTNAYGNALKGISQYIRDNGTKTLATVTTSSFITSADFAAFGTAYSTAFNKINGTNVTYSFDGAAFNVSGTGAGGGTGTCGVNLKGSVTTAGFTVPLNLDYCLAGIQAGSCTAGNASLNQSLAGQGGIAGATNLVYTYSAACAAGALSIALK